MKKASEFKIPHVSSGELTQAILSASLCQVYHDSTVKANQVIGSLIGYPDWKIEIVVPSKEFQFTVVLPASRSIGEILDEVIYRCDVLATWKQLEGKNIGWHKLTWLTTVVCGSVSNGVVYDVHVAEESETYKITLSANSSEFGESVIVTSISKEKPAKEVIAHAAQMAARLTDKPS